MESVEDGVLISLTPDGVICVEFEGFEAEGGDVILPNLKLFLTVKEHFVAWVESLLLSRNRRVKRFSDDLSTKRLNAMLRVTQKDPCLVYLGSSSCVVIVVRNGCVVKVPFSVSDGGGFMDGFMALLGEDGDKRQTVSGAFVRFVKENVAH